MSRTYQLDTESAKQAENIGAHISETGCYIGTLISAESIVSRNKSEGVELSFKSDEGQTANFITLWTHNKDGKELYSLKTLNALMTCVEARTLTPIAGKIEKRVDGNKQIVSATIFPELTSKRVGLLLQKAPYTKGDGSAGYKMEIFVPFEAATKRTAREKLDKVIKGEALPKLIAMLKDKPMQQMANANSSHGPAPTGEEFCDDITN